MHTLITPADFPCLLLRAILILMSTVHIRNPPAGPFPLQARALCGTDRLRLRFPQRILAADGCRAIVTGTTPFLSHFWISF